MINQPLQFRQPSLRETIVDALAFIGVQDYSDFDLKEEFFNNPERGIHDARHLYRVMIAAALIAKKLNEPRRGLLATTLVTALVPPRPSGRCTTPFGISTSSLPTSKSTSAPPSPSTAAVTTAVSR